MTGPPDGGGPPSDDAASPVPAGSNGGGDGVPAGPDHGPDGVIGSDLARRVESSPVSSGGQLRVATPLDSDESRIPPTVRRDSRVGPPPRHPQWMINQLPVGMLQSDFFVRFTSIFQELGTVLMEDADLVQHIPDLTVTPVPMISQLASWIGVDTIDRSLPERQQRVILASSATALAHRGTVAGLKGYLEMLSGTEAEVTDGGGVWPEGDAPPDFAWVRMTVAGTGHLSEDEFVAMVRDEIPAHVRAELWIDKRRVMSTAEEEPR